jgi:hypothetical protein
MQRPTLYSCFFYFFVPSETLFTSFTKENHQQRQQLLVFMQRRSEHLPLLLPLKLFPQYSPKNTNQEKQQLLYAKKIKTFASSSSFASSSLTTATLFTQKHQPRTTTSLCKQDQNICFFLFFFLLLLLLSHSLHILHKIILRKAATATWVSERSNTFVFLPSLSNYIHILHKKTPTTTTTTVTSLCKKDQN